MQSEEDLVDAIAAACAVSTENGLMEVAGLAISLRRRVLAVERRLDEGKSLSFDSNAEYRAWCRGEEKPRYRRQAGSAPWP